MGVAWVVRDSLLNASCASAQRRKQLLKSWAKRTLQVSSIDMSFVPPLIVARVYNLSNSHWVLRLLLIAPTREYLCLKFDPMCDRPHIVGANQEELVVVDLIAEREGIEPQQRKRWSKILDAFGALAFAIAPLHSTFIQQLDGVSCHPACLLTLHCALSRRVVKGILQVPQDRLWLLREMTEATLYFSRSKLASTPRTQRYIGRWLRCTPNPNMWTPLTHAFLVMAHLTWRATNVRFFIVPCMRPSCVNRRFVLGCANSRRPTLPLLLLLLLLLLPLLLLLLLTPVLVCLLLLLLLLLTPVVVCGSVASGM